MTVKQKKARVEAQRRWKKRHPEKARAIDARRKVERRVWLNKIKQASGCVDCGSREQLEFDHVRGVKLFTIGAGTNVTRSRVALLAEIAKCEVRCRPCHHKRSNHGRRRAA